MREEEHAMIFSKKETSGLTAVLAALVFFVVPLVAVPDTAQARRDGDDDRRSEFTGIIQARPEGSLQGNWVIAGRAVTTDVRTEFDQSQGKLTVGNCAKVHLRDGRVHEIDSEPMGNCR
jgi:hypothetical protein